MTKLILPIEDIGDAWNAVTKKACVECLKRMGDCGAASYVQPVGRSTVTVTKDHWKAPQENVRYRDLNNIQETDTIVERFLNGEIASRAIVQIEILPPARSYVQYTDVSISPYIVNTPESAKMCRHLIECGVMLAAHTNLDVTNLANNMTKDGKTYIRLMFWALTKQPSMSLEFDVRLY